MKKKLLVALLAIISVICLMFALTGSSCNDASDNGNGDIGGENTPITGDEEQGGDSGHTKHNFVHYVSNNDATCTKDGTMTAKCESCEVTDTITDTGTKLGHSFINYISDNNATCMKDGTKTAKCERCTETHSVTDEGTKLSHNFINYEYNNDATCGEDGTETGKCETCNETDIRTKINSKLDHVWNSQNAKWAWTVKEDHTVEAKITLYCINNEEHTTEVSAQLSGSYSYAGCVNVGIYDMTGSYALEEATLTDSFYKEFPAIGHDFSTEFTVDSEPTCIVAGSKSKHCSRCTATDEVTEIPAIGHDFEELWTWNEYSSASVNIKCKNNPEHIGTYTATITDEITVAPQCEKTGMRRYTATVEEAEFTGTDVKDRTLPATGHTEVIDKAIASVCNRAGKTEGSHCMVCKTVLTEQKPIAALMHDFDDSVCKYCGILAADADFSDCLVFTPVYNTNVIENQTEENIVWYAVTGVSDPNVKYLKIPVNYNGKPVNKISETAFKDCALLESIEIADTIGSGKIESNVFAECSSLKSITSPTFQFFIPESVTHLVLTAGEQVTYGTFRTAENVESITLPASVNSIAADAFGKCSKLQALIVDSGNSKYHSDGNCIIETDSKTLVAGCCSSVIPSDSSVTSIAEKAFYGCTALESILIPENIQQIGIKAFSDCGALGSITVEHGNKKYFSVNNCIVETQSKTLVIGCRASEIPSDRSVTAIGEYAFFECKALTSFVVPDSVKAIGGHAFEGCSSLAEITIPFTGESADGNEKTHLGYIFGSYFYEYNNNYVPASLKKVIINEATKIRNYAFYDCRNISYIELKDTVNEIGIESFKDCRSLKEFCIPKSMYYIGVGVAAFYGCSGLAKLTVQEGNNSYYAVDNCIISKDEKLLLLGCKNSIIPDDGSVICINSYAFGGNIALTSLTVPESIKYIQDSAFAGCNSLTKLTLPVYEERSYSGYATFGRLFSQAECAGSILISQSDGYSPFYRDYYVPQYLSKVVIIGSGELIPYYFQGCTMINEIEISQGITKIGQAAFVNCRSLSKISLPDSLEKIDNYLFEVCKSLHTIKIPESVTTIGDTAFGQSGLTEIFIPYSVESIANNPFIECENLTSISVDVNNKNYSSRDGILYNKDQTEIISVPLAISGSVVIPDGVEVIQQWLFYGRADITEITLPAQLKTIENTAFRECNGLTVVTIPDSVTIIESDAFMGCSGLEKIIVGKGVSSIGYDAFYSCNKLEKVYYCNTAEDWNNIDNHYYQLNNATLYYYSETKPAEAGNYWHYVNGEAVEW